MNKTTDWHDIAERERRSIIHRDLPEFRRDEVELLAAIDRTRALFETVVHCSIALVVILLWVLAVVQLCRWGLGL